MLTITPTRRASRHLTLEHIGAMVAVEKSASPNLTFCLRKDTTNTPNPKGQSDGGCWFGLTIARRMNRRNQERLFGSPSIFTPKEGSQSGNCITIETRFPARNSLCMNSCQALDLRIEFDHVAFS
jgi:hypothetical protein